MTQKILRIQNDLRRLNLVMVNLFSQRVKRGAPIYAIPSLYQILHEDGFQRDAKEIENDWNILGKDINNSMESITQEEEL